MSPGGPINERMSAGAPEGAVLVTSTIDNRERVFGFRKLTNYPIYAIVGLSLEDALAGWSRNRNAVAIGILLTILAGISITIALRRKDHAESALRGLNETLESRVQERTKELSLANQRTVKALEDERRRLARELHDRVSSNLSAITLSLENIETALSDSERAKVKNALFDCSALAADSATSARDISTELHPSVLDYMGVIPALHDLGERFQQRTGIPVSVNEGGNGRRLPADREIALYRIAQEALVNCSKHSKANSVTIQLSHDPKRVELRIRDDGAGFQTAQLLSPGLGLLSMQERAQAVGGSCSIESAIGEGTLVKVEIPLS